jgi:hypothetical protein
VGLKSLKSLNLTNVYPNNKNKNNKNNKVKSKPLLAGKNNQASSINIENVRFGSISKVSYVIRIHEAKKPDL